MLLEPGENAAEDLAKLSGHDGLAHDPADRADMRVAEQRIMIELGIDDIIHYGVDEAGSSIVEEKA